MKIHRRKLIITAVITTILLAGVLVYMNNASNQQSQSAGSTDKNTAKKVINSTNNPEGEKNAKIEVVPNQPYDEDSTMSLYISSLSQDDQAVYSSAIVEDSTTGNCTFSFKNKSNGTVIEQTKPVQLVTNYYACGTFVAQKDNLLPGAWVMTVTLEANGTAVSSGAKELEVIK